MSLPVSRERAASAAITDGSSPQLVANSHTEAKVSSVYQGAVKHSFTQTGEEKPLKKARADETLKAQAVSHVAFPHVKASDPAEFTYFTKYLSSCGEILEAARARCREISELCSLLSSGDWNSIIQVYRQTPDDLAKDGLKAYHDGILATQQFATILSCRSLLVEFPDVEIHTQSIFNEDGSVNETAESVISQTLMPKGIANENPPFLNRDQLELFFRRMQSQPNSEKVFFFVKMDPYDWDQLDRKNISDEMLSRSRTVTKEIAVSIGINIFHQFNREGGTFRLVPTLSMMQQFLEVYARPGDAVKITPVIGLSSIEDIVNNITTHSRDMGFAFPEVSLPKIADELIAPYAADFTAHDFYHAFVVSDVPTHLRLAYKLYADILKEVKREFAPEDEISNRYIDMLYERIIDMEHPHFRQNIAHLEDQLDIFNATEGKKLLSSLTFQQGGVTTRLAFMLIHDRIAKGEESDRAKKEVSNELKKFTFVLQQRGLIPKVAHRLHKSGFCEKFKISTHDLKESSDSTELRARMLLEQVNRTPEESLPSELKEEVEIDGKKMTRQDLEKQLLLNALKMNLAANILECYS